MTDPAPLADTDTIPARGRLMRSWSELRDWRRETRAELMARRIKVPLQERERRREVVSDLLLSHVPELHAASIGFCWPFKGEIDMRPLVRSCLAAGADAALPVVVERAQPLEFWQWRPRIKMQRGVWDIPFPAERRPVQPTILLVPLVGFDGDGYRLGYGGGYYDRTLAAAARKPLAIGIGYESARLETIHPQWHDVPMDAIATEQGFTWLGDAKRIRRDLERSRADSATATLASPPCSMAELDPAARGYMSRPELLDLLRQLLEGERAGARAVGAMSREETAGSPTLRAIAMDEARYCAMLTRHIVRLGGTPSRETGAFYDKLMAVQDPAQRLDLLNRGQGWVVRKLREALPKIEDDALHRDLAEMLDVHERNIAHCSTLMDEPAQPKANIS